MSTEFDVESLTRRMQCLDLAGHNNGGQPGYPQPTTAATTRRHSVIDFSNNDITKIMKDLKDPAD